MCFSALRRVWTVSVDPHPTSVGTSTGFKALGPEGSLARLPEGKATVSWQPSGNEGVFNSFLYLPESKIANCTPMF